MPAIRTYTRPMGAWWRRNPFYGWYMLRELTSLVIVAYALYLLCGIYHLAHGAASWERWRASLSSPISIVLHVALFLVMVYHAWTWFKVMPKTMPFIRVGGKRVGDDAIVGSGVVAGVVAFVVLVGVAKWLAS
jgi:succinate dehydrogenase subunit C